MPHLDLQLRKRKQATRDKRLQLKLKEENCKWTVFETFWDVSIKLSLFHNQKTEEICHMIPCTS